jgi:hypothetical protein
MPEVHLPHLEEESEGEHHPATRATKPHGPWRSIVKIGLEVLLITTGVSLGLAGEQWRENRHHQELAHISLERFRSEFQANRKAVALVVEDHRAELNGLVTYMRENNAALTAHMIDRAKPIPYPLPRTITGSADVDFSAWDFALATQSLAYIDPDLVASMSSTYRLQQMYLDAHRNIQQASYQIIDIVIWLNGVATYFGDAELYESLLLKRYDDILPRLEKVLGGH